MEDERAKRGVEDLARVRRALTDPEEMSVLVGECHATIEKAIKRHATGRIMGTELARETLAAKAVAKLDSLLQAYEGRSSLQYYIDACVQRRIAETYYEIREQLTQEHVPTKRERMQEERAAVARRERAAVFEKYKPFLEKLSLKRRAVFTLYYRDDHDHKFIAEFLELSEDVVRQLKHRACRRLERLASEAGTK